MPNSSEQEKLFQNARTLAQSKEAHDQSSLLHLLVDDSFLTRLDTKEEMTELGQPLRVERVVQALAQNGCAAAQQTIVGLSASAVFTKEDRRVVALLRASRVVRPPPATLVQFWDAHSQPDDTYTNITIIALIENGTAPAINLFEQKLKDPRHDQGDDTKFTWLHAQVMSHRNDEQLLLGCERLLQGTLAAPLKSALIDSLFDYRPDEWFSEAKVYVPPDPARATLAAKATLKRIARHLLESGKPSRNQEAAIDRVTGLNRTNLHDP